MEFAFFSQGILPKSQTPLLFSFILFFIFWRLLKDDTKIYHYLTNDKKEIDFILQRNEKIIAVEVKSSSKVGKDDFRHIIEYQKKSSKDVLGIVFYMGENVLHINDKCVALPMGYFY